MHQYVFPFCSCSHFWQLTLSVQCSVEVWFWWVGGDAGCNNQHYPTNISLSSSALFSVSKRPFPTRPFFGQQRLAMLYQGHWSGNIFWYGAHQCRADQTEVKRWHRFGCVCLWDIISLSSCGFVWTLVWGINEGLIEDYRLQETG